MANSYGFSGKFPDGALAGKYSYHNGEFTGEFYFSQEEVEQAEKELQDSDGYGVEVI